MEKEANIDIKLANIFYFIPFSQDGNKGSANEDKAKTQDARISLDEGLDFQIEPINIQNLVRTDIKRCFENLKHYALLDRGNKNLELRSYSFERDENGKETGKIILTNLSKVLHLNNIYVYRINDDNQFLVLSCEFKKVEGKDGEDTLTMEQIVRTHAHFHNNYFRGRGERKITASENVTTVDITRGDEPFNGFLTICVDGKEYTFGEGAEQLGKNKGVRFDFNNYQVQYISHLFLLNCKKEDALSYAERLAKGNKRTALYNPEEELFQSDNFVSSFSGFGTSVIHYLSDNSDAIGVNEIETRKRRHYRTFNRELLNDFFLAINYRYLIKRQIIRIGEVNYEKDDGNKYLRIKEEVNKYYKESALYYFETVSQFNYINEWYRKLLKGLEVVNLYEELETKLKDANTYIGFKAEEIREKRSTKTARIAFVFSTVVGAVLAILSYVQVIYQIPELENKVTFSIVGSAAILLIAIIGGLILWHLQKKEKDI